MHGKVNEAHQNREKEMAHYGSISFQEALEREGWNSFWMCNFWEFMEFDVSICIFLWLVGSFLFLLWMLVILMITLLVWGWPRLLHILFCICTSREFDRKHGLYDSSGFFDLFPIMGRFGLLDLLLDWSQSNWIKMNDVLKLIWML